MRKLLLIIAATLFSLTIVKSQIVYVDIDPDTTIHVPNEVISDTSASYYYLDINNDVVVDYWFVSKTIQSITYLGVYLRRADSLENKTVGGCVPPGVNDYYFGDTINNSLNWVNTSTFSWRQDMGSYNCFPPTNDVIIGLRFYIGSEVHFGWVRCFAQDSSVTVKDYAYNAVAGEAILTGQMVSLPELNSFNENINCIVSNGSLFIKTRQNNIDGFNVKIFNMAGSMVINKDISGSNASIDISFMQPGIYLLEAEINGNLTSNKFAILS